MSLDELYRNIRELVSGKFRIEIRDGVSPEVAIVPDSDYEKHPWTHFGGLSLEDCLIRAITKLRSPSMDYQAEPTFLDPEGCLWLAKGDSIYGERHTRLFLRGPE